MQTTLEKIRAQSPCAGGWTKLLAHLGKTKADDEPLPLSVILESNGLDDTLWCFQAVDGFEREKRLYVVWCARQVQHLMVDPRSLTALDVAEQFANSLASPEELGAAAAAANAAAANAAAAWAAAVRAAANAADASDAVRAAANAADAANAAAANAAAANAAAAWAAAANAASDAARAAAWDATRASQTEELKRVLACTEAGINPYPPKE